MKRRDRTTNLICWLCYSVLIPALAIFLRWIATLSLYGPTSVDPLSMLRSGEVIFLAAVLVAETLGDAPDHEAQETDHRKLIMNRAILMVLLVLSLMVFGAFTPLETSSVGNNAVLGSSSISGGGDLPWLGTKGGQLFLAIFNAGLFLAVFVITLRARWLYWTMEQSDKASTNSQTTSTNDYSR